MSLGRINIFCSCPCSTKKHFTYGLHLLPPTPLPKCVVYACKLFQGKDKSGVSNIAKLHQSQKSMHVRTYVGPTHIYVCCLESGCNARVALHQPTHRGCRGGGGAHKQRWIPVIKSARPTTPTKPPRVSRDRSGVNVTNLIYVQMNKWDLPTVINIHSWHPGK